MQDPAPETTGYGGAHSAEYGGGAAGVDTIADQLDWGPSEDAPASEGANICSVCGKRLDDEFDRVIGLCEDHQREQRGEEPVSGGELHDQWWIRPRHGGHPSGPFPLDDVRGRLRTGELAPSDQVSKDGRDFAPVDRYPELAYITALQSVRGLSPRATGVSVHSGPDLGRYLRWGVLLLVVGAVGYGIWSQQDLIGRIYANLMEGRVSSGPIGLNPYRRTIEAWTQELVRPQGRAAPILKEASKHHLEDSWEGYQAADQALRRALILEPDNPTVLGAYVENLVLWRLPLAGPEEVKQAGQAIRFGLRLEPANAELHRAAAALAIERNQLNVCQENADAALQVNPRDGRARLLLAGCFIQGNVPLAIEEAERARRSLPELRRSSRLLAHAYARTGRYTTAQKLLEARLAEEPRNALLHIELGELTRMLGRSEEATQHLRRAAALDGYDQRSFVRLADLQLEMRRPGQAIAAYQGALDAQEPQGPRGAEIFTGWARAELLAGRPQRAAQMADEALSFSRDHLPALILRGEAALLLDQLDVAAQVADRSLKEGPNEPSALVLAGRAATRQGRVDVGRQHLEKAAKNDRRDPRLAGILAAHYLQQGLTNQAYVLMRDAAEVDPEEAKARNRFTPVALSDAPVAEAIALFQQSSKIKRNAPVAYAVMGLMYYFSGEPERAYEAVRRSLRLDDANLVGLIYKAQLDLEAGRYGQGEQSIRRLLALEKGFALGHVILARILTAQGRTEEAREEYESALRSNPGFIAAQVELTGLKLAAGSPGPDLEEDLQKAFVIHPNSVRLRNLMLEAGL